MIAQLTRRTSSPIGPMAFLAVALVLASCAAAASPTPTPSPTQSPTPSPTLEPTPSPTPATVGISVAAQAYLVPLAGYEYVALPTSVEQQAVAGLQSDLVRDYFKGYAIQSVTRDGAGQAVAWVLDMQPSYLALPGFMEGVVAGMAGTTNATTQQITLAGQAAYQLVTSTQQFVAWQTGSFIVVVFGADLAPVTAVATALIEAHA